MMKIVLLLGLMVVAAQGYAKGDDGLYDDIAPPGSAFIRVLNGGDKAIDGASVKDSTLESIAACDVSPYLFFPAGDVSVSAAATKQRFTLEPDQFYTAVYKAGELSLIKDTYFKNKRKSLLSLYNMLDSKNVSLTANAGKVPVFKSVAQGKRVEREINAVAIDMEVQPDGDSQIMPGKQNFTRGDVFSLFVCPAEAGTTANWVKWSVVAPK